MSTLSGMIKTALEVAASVKAYPSLAPEKTKGRYIVYSIIGAPTLNALKGKTDLQNRRIQVDCWAANHDDAWALAALALAGMSGPTLDDSPPGFRALQITEGDHSIDPDTREHRVMLEFSVWARVA